MAWRVVRTLLAFSLLAVAAGAQVLTGTVRDTVDRRPIAGVVLTLIDSSGNTVIRQLTDERGEYRIVLGSTVRSARAIRIGYAARELPIRPHAGGDVQLDFSLLALPTMIQTVRVLADTRCPIRKDRAAALGLWEQARAGLLATVVARETNPGSMFRLLYTRGFESASDRVAYMRVRADSSVGTASFVAAHSAQDFVQTGFASNDANTRSYFGPDAQLLLSNEFAAAYCLQLADADRSRKNQVGIRFLPAYTRDGATDIDGTLWIDTASRELRDVEYTYLGVPAAVARAFHPGGYVSFRTMQNGTVIIDRWSIRAGFPAIDRSAIRTAVQDLDFGLPAWRVTEDGGELAWATWPTGLAWRGSLGALQVRAVNTLGEPVAGMGVSLFPSYYFAITDSTGAARIDDLVPGPYEVTITDPRLAELGLGIPAHFRFDALRDSTTTTTIKVPPTESFIGNRCAGVRLATRDSVFVFGRVVTQDGHSVPDAKVTFAVRNRGEWDWRKDDVATANDGLFQSCWDWKVGDEILINVHQRGVADVAVTRRFDSNLMAVRIVVESPK